MFVWGYTTDVPPVARLTEARSGAVEILYLGQYIARKGLDLALRALADIREYEWRLTMVGTGPLLGDWSLLAKSLGIGDRVRFLSAVENSETARYLADCDLLLLPSRYDGWGAVVNEALMAGVPVICSDCCGAKDLLAETWRGSVFRSESVSSLKGVLEQWIRRGRRTTAEHSRIRSWAECLSGEVGAAYLLAVFAHVYNGAKRPAPPWVDLSQSAQQRE
jgi:glycosyltransferase involved in cell wall biosynthesis